MTTTTMTAAQAAQAERSARERAREAEAALAAADEALAAARAASGVDPGDIASARALVTARRTRERLYDAVATAQAGATEATRRRVVADEAAKAADRAAARVEALALVPVIDDAKLEVFELLQATRARLIELDGQLVQLNEQTTPLRERCGIPPRVEPPSSWSPLWRDVHADLVRMAGLFRPSGQGD